jgi:hypothetical protein
MLSLAGHGPALLTSLVAKLEQLYKATKGQARNDPVLQKIPRIITKAKEVQSQFGQ